MNPFDLSGPEFLLFYLTLAVCVITGAALLRRSWESGGDIDARQSDELRRGLLLFRHEAHDQSHPVMRDPYAIAYLRGGAGEALRLAVISLVDRRLLEYEGTKLKRPPGVKPSHATREIERALLMHFSNATEASSIFNNSGLARACDGYAHDLASLGLLPDDAAKRRRRMLMLSASVFLAGVAIVKIVVALSRGRTNVAILCFLTLIALMALGAAIFRTRTRLGEQFLTNVQTLFSDLRTHSSAIKPGGSTNELVLMAAVYGAASISPSTFPWVRELYPKAADSTATSHSSSGCGSSSGSSSCGSSCGGGCGGCGS